MRTEHYTVYTQSFFHIGTCSSFSRVGIPNKNNWFQLYCDIKDEFMELFRDQDTAFWLSRHNFSVKQNNLNRLTCLYLYREIIKGE